MFQKQLKRLGLTVTQSNVLDFLFEQGERKASHIAKAIHQPRGAIYKALEELINQGLVEKIDKDKRISTFRALHPRNLEKLIEQKEHLLRQEKTLFAELLPGIISSYNLTINRPGVKFYEGEAGFKKILYDTLSSKTDIYMMINRDELEKEEVFRRLNDEYREKRERVGVKKKILRICEGSCRRKERQDKKYKDITEIKCINQKLSPFKAIIQIYDKKISYQLINSSNLVSVLIEDEHIYQLHKTFFELIWASTQSFCLHDPSLPKIESHAKK